MDGLDRFLESVKRLKLVSPGQWTASCPALGHGKGQGDVDRSLSISRGNGSGMLIHCHAGCSPEDVLAGVGMKWKDILPPRENTRRNPSPAAASQTPTVKQKASPGAITRYEIRDPSGTLIAVHVREDHSAGKKIWWELPDGTKGLGGRKLETLPFYGIDRLSADAKVAVLVEGEKATDAPLSNGIPAVGTVTGAGGTPGDDALRPLLGRTVYLWPDNDDPGRKHMAKIGAALLRLGHDDVRVIDWKGAPLKGDAADLFALEGARDNFDALMDEARLFTGTATEGKTEVADSYDERQEPEALKEKWPDPPDQAAYYGLAGEFARLVGPHTEADPVALVFQLLVMAGNMIGRGPHAVVEADRHYSNLSAVAVGVTGHGRKGTSAGQVRRPLRAIDEHWEQNRIQGGLSSGEGLIWAVRDPVYKQEPIRTKKGGTVTGYQEVLADDGVSDKRLMVFAPEFSSVLKVAGRDGSTLSATIRQAWDTGILRIMTKNNPAVATEAHISIVGHITKQELLRHLDATEKANGFANRFLWFCVKRSKMLPMGGKIDSVDFAPFLSRLRNVVDISRKGGERALRWDDEAAEYWCSIYGPLSSGGTGMAAEVTSRAEAQVLRLSLVYAVLDGAESMCLPHLQAAKALWDYSAASVRYIFGDSLGDPVADEIMAELKKAGNDGRTRNQIRELFSRHLRSDEIARALGLLQEQGTAYSRVDDQTGGRPAERWYAAPGSRTTVEDEGGEGE